MENENEIIEGEPIPEVTEQEPTSVAMKLLFALGMGKIPAKFWYKPKERENRSPKDYKYNHENSRRIAQIANGKLKVSPPFVPRSSQKVNLTD